MPRADVSEQRKEQILDAAAIVFSQQGLANARMDDIVKQSGLSKGALYWYFKSKDEIIFALMHRFFDRDLHSLDQLLDADLSAYDTLLQHIISMTEEYTQLGTLMSLMYEYYSSATRDAETRTFFRTHFQQYHARVRQIVQHGIDSGEFIQVDVDGFVITMMAMIEGLLLLKTIDVEMAPFKEQVLNSFSLLLDGIKLR